MLSCKQWCIKSIKPTVADSNSQLLVAWALADKCVCATRNTCGKVTLSADRRITAVKNFDLSPSRWEAIIAETQGVVVGAKTLHLLMNWIFKTPWPVIWRMTTVWKTLTNTRSNLCNDNDLSSSNNNGGSFFQIWNISKVCKRRAKDPTKPPLSEFH